MTVSIREHALLWPDGKGGWTLRRLLDLGEELAYSKRFRWATGEAVAPADLARVARELARAGGGGREDA